MGEEETKRTESRSDSESVSVDSVPPPTTIPPPPPPPPQVKENESKKPDPQNGVVQEHSVIPVVTSSVAEKDAVPAARTDTGHSVDRDAVLARVEAEKRLALIKAWEESEKTKAENRAYKKLSAVGFWEDTKKASVEAQLKKIEEKLERQKAEYVEKMQNKMAEIHRLAEEKRAMVEAQRREEFLKVEETAAKFRARGYSPRKLLSCFSG